jgi:hypothetical protein
MNELMGDKPLSVLMLLVVLFAIAYCSQAKPHVQTYKHMIHVHPID